MPDCTRALPILVAAAWALLAPTPAATQVICDPENPACASGDEDDPPASSAAEGTREDANGSLTICDPENPACNTDESADEEEQQTLPDTPTPDREEFGLTEAPINAQYQMTWGTSLAVDTAWQGNGEDVGELGASANLGMEIEASSRLRVVLEGEFRYWGGMPDWRAEEAPPVRTDYLARVGESYFLWRPGDVSLRVGNLITAWGSTDLTRPGDVINARDARNYGFVGPAAQDAQRPHLAAEVTWSPSPNWSLTGVAVPFFVPDAVVLFGRDIALAGPRSPLSSSFPVAQLLQSALDASSYEEAQGLVYSPSYPDERLRNASLGARLTATFLNTDVGIGYYWGWDRTPYIDIDEDAAELFGILANDEQFLQDFDFAGLVSRNPGILSLSQEIADKQANGEQVLVQEYLRRHTIVVDAARYIGPIGVRADVALSPAQNFATDSFTTIRRPTVFGALGLSYERAQGEGGLGITAEGFWLEPLGRDSAVTEAFVEEERRGDPDAQAIVVGERLYGVAAGVSYDIPVVDVGVQLGGVYNLSSEDLVARASARREVVDGVFATLGASIFEGPPPSERLTIGGLYDVNDLVYLGVDGVF